MLWPIESILKRWGASMKRYSVLLGTAEIALLLITGAGCGANKTSGPGGAASIRGSQQMPLSGVLPIVATRVSPNSVGSQTASLKIEVFGTGFSQASIVLWEDEPLGTSFTDTSSLVAIVPSVLLSTPLFAHISVADSNDLANRSGSILFSVLPQVGPRVRSISTVAADLAWDPLSAQIYLATADPYTDSGTLIGVNPSTLKIEVKISVMGQPSSLSVSRTDKYVYVAYSGSEAIERRTLPTLTDDGRVPMGSTFPDLSAYIADIESSPVADSTLAAVRVITGADYVERTEVSVMDNLIARPLILCGSLKGFCSDSAQGLFEQLQWDGAGTSLYLGDEEPSGLVLSSAPVMANGVTPPTIHYTGSPLSPGSRLHYDRTSHLVYTDSGAVLDPLTGGSVGSFPAAGPMVVDSVNGIAFFLAKTLQPHADPGYILEGFDVHTFSPVCSLPLPFIQGRPDRLISWGRAGFAFNTTTSDLSGKGGYVYFVDDEGGCRKWSSGRPGRDPTS